MAPLPPEPEPAGPVRVLHVIGGVSATFGGPTVALLELLRLMAGTPAACAVAVVAADRADESVLQELRATGAAVTSFPRERFHPAQFSGAFSRALPRLLAGCEVAHIHSMWSWGPYWGLRCAQRQGIPAVIRPAGALDPFDLRKHAPAKRLLGPLFLRRLFRPPNVFHCTARREAARLESYGGDAKRLVLPLPIAAGPRPQDATRAAARAALGLAPGDRALLFLGRLNYKKGIDLILRAMARPEAAGTCLLLAGDGDSAIKGEIARLTAEFWLAERIRTLGFVGGGDKTRLLQASDLLVLPSMNENFGVSVVEALQASLPVLISDEVYIADDIQGSRAVGVCVRSAESVARGIAALTGDPSQREALGREARAVWEQRYSPEVLRPAYLRLYRRLDGDNQIAAAGRTVQHAPRR